MRTPWTEVYLHVVWSTWRRQPFISPELQQRVFGALAHQCMSLDADVIAIGGMPDHVHVLARMPTTISISEFVRRLKGASSHLVTHVLRSPEPFKWQGGYGAFSVSKRHVPVVRDYVQNQEQHHREGTTHLAFERTGE
ncbi:IS200/IS605 family transposase [Longimicrobium sp.]|uniref:IS200/IS605 family transposase n=1 Tax=Longimicrobium sp. TaxID=2029185 RepID=UPI002B592C72|nr:IS200/IS605 family transposase [Longimicrobium sp.]HSU14125.1 IS200/IS605 family transposase [Longimicrobium sp.]